MRVTGSPGSARSLRWLETQCLGRMGFQDRDVQGRTRGDPGPWAAGGGGSPSLHESGGRKSFRASLRSLEGAEGLCWRRAAFTEQQPQETSVLKSRQEPLCLHRTQGGRGRGLAQSGQQGRRHSCRSSGPGRPLGVPWRSLGAPTPTCKPRLSQPWSESLFPPPGAGHATPKPGSFRFRISNLSSEISFSFLSFLDPFLHSRFFKLVLNLLQAVSPPPTFRGALLRLTCSPAHSFLLPLLMLEARAPLVSQAFFHPCPDSALSRIFTMNVFPPCPFLLWPPSPGPFAG